MTYAMWHRKYNSFDRTRYVGEGSAACAMGLIAGLVILILQRYISAESVHQLLTFNPADFFTCVSEMMALLYHHPRI